MPTNLPAESRSGNPECYEITLESIPVYTGMTKKYKGKHFYLFYSSTVYIILKSSFRESYEN